MLEAYALHPDAFTSSENERARLPLAWWEARVAEESDAGEVVFGAFVEGHLAGVAGLTFDRREKARHKATLFGMYVPERYRQHGLGRKLVSAALEHARMRPWTLVVQFTVTEGNARAQSLYESCGFRPFGVEPCAVKVGETFVSKVHMWCRLQRQPQEDAA